MGGQLEEPPYWHDVSYRLNKVNNIMWHYSNINDNWHIVSTYIQKIEVVLLTQKNSNWWVGKILKL